MFKHSWFESWKRRILGSPINGRRQCTRSRNGNVRLGLHRLEERLAPSATLVRDINQTPITIGNQRQFTALNSGLYFQAGDETHSSGLWRSEGNASAATLVKAFSYINDAPMVVVGSNLYFSANSELWKSDGTAAGTVVVRDVNATPDLNPLGLTGVGSLLFFHANDGIHGLELWRTDGTAAGTFMVRDSTPGADWSQMDYMIAAESKLYFTLNTASGRELWVSDGTDVGTTLLWDNINPSVINPNTNDAFATVGTNLFFVNWDDTLWTSDGTAAGTSIIKSGGGDFQYISELEAAGPRVFFSAHGNDGSALWASDGTTSGTAIVRSGHAAELTGVGPMLYFVDQVDTWSLWKSDGSTFGTVIVAPSNPAVSGALPTGLFAAGSTLYFTPYVSLSATPELWKSDGTDAGTVFIKSVQSLAIFDSAGDSIYFGVDNGSGFELWQSDGTVSGTEIVPLNADPASGNLPSYPRNLIQLGSSLLFFADGAGNGSGLWRSDGTASGTVLLKQLGISFLNDAVVIGSTVYFRGDDGSHGQELWKSDGTAEGTVMVKDISPGEDSTYYNSPTAVGSRLFFFTFDGLWVSDGTDAGTVMFSDVVPDLFNNSSMGAAGGFLVFSVGEQLWRSDGTSLGTQSLIPPGPELAFVDRPSFTVIGDKAYYFRLSPGGTTVTVWETNGTSSLPKYTLNGNTVNPSLTDIVAVGADLYATESSVLYRNGTPMFSGLAIEELEAVGSELYFRSGGSVYRANGDSVTLVPTFNVANAFTDWVVIGDSPYLVSPNGGLWQTDGTEAGTVMLSDQFYPIGLTVDVGYNLFFASNDGHTGTELWKYAINEPPVDTIIEGTTGNDIIRLMAGTNPGEIRVRINGTVIGTYTPTGRMIVRGLDGNDDLLVEVEVSTPVWLYGGDGNDELRAGGGNDFLFGEDGNDRLFARIGDDQLDGGDGNDELRAGTGSDIVHGGEGCDELWGGTGNDQLFGDAGNDLLRGGGGCDRLEGGDGNDELRAGPGGDTLLGGNGCDTLKGGQGSDWMEGGNDNDRLDGQAGNDIMLGGTGDDLLKGGSGRDLQIGGLGADRIEGNAEEDILIAGGTLFDDNALALQAIHAEWTSGNSYAARVANITGGTGLTQGYQLWADAGAFQSVFDDNDHDVLCGGAGIDWFFANINGGGTLDTISDLRANELWTDTVF